MIKVAPSILSADFTCLGSQVEMISASGAARIHVDVMDGRFVPPISFGPPIASAIRSCTKLPVDAHLMVADPERQVADFVQAGVDSITIHMEACLHLDRVLRLIRSYGKEAGVALNPATPIAHLFCVLDTIDLVLLMTVNPGYGGQKYLPGMTEKIAALRERLDKEPNRISIHVDGGICLENAGIVAAAGADVLITGSSFFGTSDRACFVREMMHDSR